VNLNIWDCFNFFERETPSHHGLQFSDFQERHDAMAQRGVSLGEGNKLPRFGNQ
jgi:hypothetical protein